MIDWNEIAAELEFELAGARSAGGGCINSAATLTSTSGARIFVKANSSTKLGMFETEAQALAEIAATKTIRVPRPISSGVIGSTAYLALEHIATGSPARGSWAKLGKSLTALHRHRPDDSKFGWDRDNVIGETHQPNAKEDDWATFFTEHRLRHQLELATEKGYDFDRADDLLDRVPGFLSGHSPPPSLLHGDLWSGNAAFDEDGEPFIFDPATYYGDAETDLAFTEMFGSFDREFYLAYDTEIPPAPGRRARKRLYNLYHLLNHTNLFGGSYAESAQAAIHGLLGTDPTLFQAPEH